ncbi:MAG: phosphoglucomutase/phosphomannomutase family protein [bacterium]
MNSIKFGTDGWRAKIAEDFTFDNVALVTEAFIGWLKEKGLDKNGVAVGYDNRFQSESFANVAAKVCSGAGIKTFLSDRAIGSPVLSYTVNNQKLGAGIMITASHNPPDWNGFKIKENFGGSAFPETTKAIEKNLSPTTSITPSGKNIEIINPLPEYLKAIAKLVDLDLIKNSGLQLFVDAMHGSGAGNFAALGLNITELRGKRDPLFGGVNPEPIAVNLQQSMSYLRDNAQGLAACIVLDGDADRLAAIDATGKFITTHQVFSLLLHHLVVHRKMSGDVVKTFNLSRLIDKQCAQHGRNLIVTPIGFKYVADLMLKQDILLGGEESGGMGIKGFIPERDGLFAGLMLFELMAKEKKTLCQIMDDLMKEHGYFYYDRIDLHTEKAQETVKKLKEKPPTEYGGKKITKVETLDGLKLNFEDESWILFRASGTEPLLRIYCEARSEDAVTQLLSAGKKLNLSS